MKNTYPFAPLLRRCLAFASALVFASLLHAQAASTGTIEGRILDSASGKYLENVRITINDAKEETFSDSTGQYRVTGVPAGTVTLKVFYTGRGSFSQLVTVAPGQIVQQDVTFGDTGAKIGANANEPVKLDAFKVSDTKEMDAKALAINEQRFARNITNVVSADEFGVIADGSIGEFMKFLPGITSDYTGGDARRFSINGAPAGNVPISMGGFDMASAAGAGTGRQVELDQVSINSVSRIEINRAPMPDTPGSALSGAVNFVPKSAFERSRPLYSYSAALLLKDAERATGHKSPGPGWGQESYKIHPGIDVSAIVPVTRNFGFTISGGYSMQYTPQSFTSMQWRGASIATNAAATALTGLPVTTPQNPYLGIFQWRDSGKETDRNSFGTTVDWRFSRADRLSLGFQYGALREHFATRVQTFQINRINPLNWGPDHSWGQASVFNAATNTNSGQMSIVNSGRIRPGRTYTPSFRWLHDGPVWKADTGAAYGNSRIVYQDIDKGAFNGVTAQRNNVQILFDDIFYLRPGKITVLDPNNKVVDPSDLNSYSIVNANSNRQVTYDTTRQAYTNVRRDFMPFGVPVGIKVGADVRTKVRDLRGPGGNLETYTWVGADQRASTTPATQAGLANDDSPAPYLDVPYSKRIPDYGMPRQQWVDNEKLWSDYKTNPNHWTRNAQTEYTALTNFSKRAEEIISSLFFRTDLAFFRNRLKITTGVRAEQTNIDAQGPLTDPSLAYQRDANGNVVKVGTAPVLVAPTTSLAYSQLTVKDRGTHAKKEYLRLFPSLNASYNVTENTIARAAYYQTVGRPDFNQYAGGLTVPNLEPFNANDLITVNNVSIKAWQAQTYMARIEYYFGDAKGGSAGQLSANYFIRDIKNAFQSVTARVSPDFLAAYGLDQDAYGVYRVVTQTNSRLTVRQYGFEIDYRQPLTFLPGWARGFDVFANISSQRAKDTDDFQDMNPFVGNWGINFRRGKWNLRINENYRGIQRRGVVASVLPVGTTLSNSIEPGTYNYRSKRLYIDVSGEYALRRSLAIFFALRNISDAPEDTKIYGPHTPSYAKFRERDDYAALWTAGIKGTF